MALSRWMYIQGETSWITLISAHLAESNLNGSTPTKTLFAKAEYSRVGGSNYMGPRGPTFTVRLPLRRFP